MEAEETEGKSSSPTIAPSEYIKHALMTTEEKTEFLRKAKISRDFGRVFEWSPAFLVFQQFLPGNVYNVTLTVRNASRVPRSLTLIRDTDPFFSIEFQGRRRWCGSVAPGLSQPFSVRFQPIEKRDYEYHAKFATDTGFFEVPIIAIGPRPILEIPDQIRLPPTPVKILSTKTILMRNIGDATASFTAHTDNSRFRVEPTSGAIEPQQTFLLTLEFLSDKSADYTGKLLLRYETSGETLGVDVECSATSIPIKLERSVIRMEDTFVGLSRSKSLTIHNRSEHIVNFQWMRYEDETSDLQRKNKFKGLYEEIHRIEIARSVDLVHYNVCLPTIHELACQRLYTDEIGSLVNEKFLYNDQSFSISPQSGEIWPHSSIDVTIFFRPLETGEFSSMAYLEVTGRENRIPLSLAGTASGPLLRFHLDTIDLRNIYLSSVHHCEAVAFNSCPIDGTLVYKAEPTNFGGDIRVNPTALSLKPDQRKSFDIEFTSNRKGNFAERLNFLIKESLEIVSLNIIGCVIYPTLRTDTEYIDFRNIALGFTAERKIVLENETEVAVAFVARILGDGDQPPLTYQAFSQASIKPDFPSNPREFSITPDRGVLPPKDRLNVSVKYTGNARRSAELQMNINAWDSDSEPLTIPVKFSCNVATITLDPTDIEIASCFFNRPYTISLTVKNESDIDGYFYFPKPLHEVPVTWKLSMQEGLLMSRQSRTILVTVVARSLGRQSVALSMSTMGELEETARCLITCDARSPFASLQPTLLDFGQVQVLEEKSMKLLVANESPIPIRFTVSLGKKKSAWYVAEASGELAAYGAKEVEVKVKARDAGTATDHVLVGIIDGQTIRATVRANVTGSSIRVEPNIFPLFELGQLFSRQEISIPIAMENFGSYRWQLLWTNNPKLSVKGNSEPKFNLSPRQITVDPNGKDFVRCNIQWNEQGTLSEEWYLFGRARGEGKAQLLGQSTFRATFVEPRISFDKKLLTFRLDVPDPTGTSHLEEELMARNKSGAHIEAEMRIDGPFRLVDDHERPVDRMNLILADGSCERIRVRFSLLEEADAPRTNSFRGLLTVRYGEHDIITDSISCKGLVNFPKIIVEPKKVFLSCLLGCTVQRTLTLKNNGPMPAAYELSWLEDSIRLERETRDAEVEEQAAGDAPHDREDGSEEKEFLGAMLARLSAEKDMDDAESLSAIIGNDPPELEHINKVLDVVPWRGSIPGNSSHLAYVVFRGDDSRLGIRSVAASLACRVAHGPTELVNVNATTDHPRFSLDRHLVDFGQQPFCEAREEKITLRNESRIDLNYKTYSPNSTSLTVWPKEGTVEANSSSELILIYRPTILGRFTTEITLELEEAVPMFIGVTGFASLPQIYVDLSRERPSDASIEYRAIHCEFDVEDYEGDLCDEDGWVVISGESNIPSAMDIEMAVERFELAEDLRRNPAENKCPALTFFVREYIFVDTGCAVIDQVKASSFTLFNYGPWIVRAKLKTSRKLKSHGITVESSGFSNLNNGERASVFLTFHPTRTNYKERITKLEERIYVEVEGGYVIPITLRGTVTYPYVDLTTKLLDFGTVIVGESATMPLLIHNKGLVDCSWEAKLARNRRKNAEVSFHFDRNAGTYAPGQFGVMDIYFKPRSPGYARGEINVTSKMGFETQTVCLRGRPIAPKIIVVEPTIKFDALLPGHQSEEKEFSVKNIGQHSVELHIAPMITGVFEIDGVSDASGIEESFEATASKSSSAESLTPNSILQPNDVRTFKVRFKPREKGTFAETLWLCIVGGGRGTYPIEISGVADIPRLRLDPSHVFPKVRKTRTKELSEPAYILDEGVFDFGHMIPKKSDESSESRKAEFSLQNISAVEARITFHLAGNNDDVFNLEPGELHVPPGETRKVRVSARPTKLGPVFEQLQLQIKDNPSTDIVRLLCTGSKVHVDVAPNEILLGRVLLYRRKVQDLTIRNSSPMGLFFRIAEGKTDNDRMKIEVWPSNGTISPWAEQVLELRATATKVGKIDGSLITVETFMSEKSEQPLSRNVIRISGEVYDISIDLEHANPLDLKIAKVGHPIEACFVIKNRGSYQVGYALTANKDESLSARKKFLWDKDMELQAANGSIGPNQTTPVRFTLLPKKELKIKECPILKCLLVDPARNSAIVANIPVRVTLAAYFSKFRVYPYPEVYFGAMSLGSKKTMYVDVENIGLFPFGYVIEELQEDNPQVGPFALSKTEGWVDVDGKDTVEIDCCPESIGTTEKCIVVRVEDSSPEDRNGKRVSLKVEAYEPA